MANYICRPVVNVPDYLVAQIQVPAGQTMNVGSVLIADSYVAAIEGNISVYAPEKMSTAKLGVKQLAIVIGGAGFETLPDGRRPAGQVDYTKYVYQAGDVVTVVFLTSRMRFEISDDAVTTPSVATVGAFLEPVDGAYALTAKATATAGTAVALKVLAKKYFRLGGLNGGQFAKTSIVVVE